MRDMMEAADVTEVSNAAETAMDGAGAVEAAMEGVPTRVTAGMTAAVSSPIVRSMVLSPLPPSTRSNANAGG
jgi:ketopantoate hydroxymethyltransferase